MQSVKKHKKPKVDRVDAREFAKAYMANVGDSGLALANAKNMETVARTRAADATLSSAEQKECIKTANFWNNIAGHINKISDMTYQKRKEVMAKISSGKKEDAKEVEPRLADYYGGWGD